MNRQLEREDCEDQVAHEFLKLLKQSENLKNITQQFTIIIEEEWRLVVLKSKKKSISLIFSNRIYVVHKYVLENKTLIILLMNFCNKIIQR